MAEKTRKAITPVTQALFDIPTPEQPGKTVPEEKRSTLDDYAFLYTATAKGNNSGLKFMATVEDAQKWCSSPESCGNSTGGQWAYFWTRVSTWLSVTGCKVIDLKRVHDDGTWDERISAAGCRKINADQWATILSPHGITVKGSPKK